MTAARLLEAMATPASQFLILVIASRNLDAASLSQFVLAQSLGNLLTVLGLGMHITEQTEMPRRTEEDGWKLYAACNLLLLPISTLVLLMAHLFSADQDVPTRAVYVSGACLSIALIADQIQGGALRAMHRHETVSRIDLIARLSSLPMVYLGAVYGPAGCIAAITICTAFAAGAKRLLIQSIRPRSPRSPLPHRALAVWQIIASSRGPLLQQAGAQMFSSADKVLMAAAGGTQILGVYAILQQSCAALHLIPAQLLQPTIARVASARKRWEMRAQLAKALRICLMLTFTGAVLLYLARDPIFKTVFDFPHDLSSDESTALLLMICAYMLISIQTPFIYFLQGAGHAMQVGLVWLASGLMALLAMSVIIQYASTLTDYVEVRLIFGIALIPLMWLTANHLKNAD